MLEWNLANNATPKAVILTAHPDDETIFCGGLMLSNPEWNWNIVCITVQSEDRKKEFERALSAFQNKGVVIKSHRTLDKLDNGMPLSNHDYDDWLSSVKNLDLKPDIVFTHNVMGEYGHPHHMSANKIAHTLFKNVWDIVFPGETGVGRQVIKTKTNKVELVPNILRVKNDVFNSAYVTQQGLWKFLSSVMEYEFKQGPELFTNGS